MTRSRALLWPTLLAVPALAVLIGLGTWQLQRLAWKTTLIEAAAERSAAAPVPVPTEADWPTLAPAETEYRRVTASGVFRHDLEIAVFTDLPTAKGSFRGTGWWILTPLEREDGSVIIVNRGFVPADRKDPASRPDGQVAGPVTVTGLMRATEDRNAFTPADDPRTNTWFTRDPAGIAAAKGLTRVAPFFIDSEASAPGGLPQGGETRLSFPNRHFEYALTWYGLALALVGVYVAFVARRLRSQEPTP
ncbi:MAG: SURF1 family protein [Labrys sp. (in: a-proteobacteria)]